MADSLAKIKSIFFKARIGDLIKIKELEEIQNPEPSSIGEFYNSGDIGKVITIGSIDIYCNFNIPENKGTIIEHGNWYVNNKHFIRIQRGSHD